MTATIATTRRAAYRAARRNLLTAIAGHVAAVASNALMGTETGDYLARYYGTHANLARHALGELRTAYADVLASATTTRAPHDFTVTVRHVDTCLSCYLTDHHDREGEALLGVTVDRSSRMHHVRAALLDEAITLEHRDATPPREAVAAAIAAAFEGVHPLKAFDRSLDAVSEDDCGDCPQAWFVVTWHPAPADDLPPAETPRDRLRARAFADHVARIRAEHTGDAGCAPALTARQPSQQQQADASRFGGAVHAEAAGWLGYVSAHAAGAGSVAAFDAAVTEAVDTLLRRQSVTPRVAACLLAFFDAPQSPVISATVAAARVPPVSAPLTARQPCQQQQARHSLPPAIGPTAYDAFASAYRRAVHAIYPRTQGKAWAPPVVAPCAVPADMAHAEHWFEVWRNRRSHHADVTDWHLVEYSGYTPAGPGYFYPGIDPEGHGGFITTISEGEAGGFFFFDGIEDEDGRRDFATLDAAERAMWAAHGAYMVAERARNVADGWFHDDDSEGPATVATREHNARCATDVAFYVAVMGRAGVSEADARAAFARNAADRGVIEVAR